MWTCSGCERIFKKEKQPHSCRTIAREQHFRNKDKAKEIFSSLLRDINNNIGTYRILSIPCCIHLFGTYDFMAALPKKDRLEIRFALSRVLNSPRLRTSVPLSQQYFKNCVDVRSKDEIDKELLGWIHEAYHLKDI